jgi:hypothetical protein
MVPHRKRDRATPQPLAFSIAGASGVTGVCEDLIRDAINQKRLRAKRLSQRRVVVLRTDLEEFLEALPDFDRSDPGQVDEQSSRAREALARKYAGRSNQGNQGASEV